MYPQCRDYRYYGRSVRLVHSIYTISVSASPGEGGSVSGGGSYIEGSDCTLTVTANPGYIFINWTENGEVVSTDAVYSFTVNGNRTLVACFAEPDVSQTIVLAVGSNWCSANVEITLNDLKAALVDALPVGSTVTISTKTRYVTYTGSRWRGTLTSLDLSQMFKVKVSTACEITLSGARIVAADHPVTIHSGANWIAFPFGETMTISNAFAGFAVSGDMITSKTQYASYTGTRWRGTLTTLEPGKGYVYKSATTGDRVFVFSMSKGRSDKK